MQDHFDQNQDPSRFTIGAQDPYTQTLPSQEQESSGLGTLNKGYPKDGIRNSLTDVQMMVRGSLLSSAEDPYQAAQKNSYPYGNDDLTLEMLQGPTTASAMTLNPQQKQYSLQQQQLEMNYGQFGKDMTSKNPPSSALNLLSNMESRQTLMNQIQPGFQRNPNQMSQEAPLSLEQFRQNNQNLQNILMQFESTPQFNQLPSQRPKASDSAPQSYKAQNIPSQLRQNQITNPSQSSAETIQDVSQFSYPNQQTQMVGKEMNQIRDNLNKIDQLQQQINMPTGSSQQTQKQSLRSGSSHLQVAGFQVLQQNENKNLTNLAPNPSSQMGKTMPTTQGSQLQHQSELNLNHHSKSANLPDEQVLKDQHKNIMKHFDDIPISKIKNMVGYQTNADMYRTDFKLPQEEEQTAGAKTAYETVQDKTKNEGSDADSDADQDLSLEEKLFSRKWKTRLRSIKEINNLLYADHCNFQNDPSYQMSYFDQFGPSLQEMIKDTNLTALNEALNCLHTYVKYAPDIKSVTFACHNYLLEKMNLTNKNFRDLLTKIILCMLTRLQGSQNTMLPEMLKRFKSPKPQTATFCMQVLLEGFKQNQHLVPDNQLKQLFKSVQTGLTHQNKQLRDSAIQILKFVCSKCKDEPEKIVGQCQNLRPIQQKELTEELSKVQKLSKLTIVLFDDQEQQETPATQGYQNQPKGGMLVNLDDEPEQMIVKEPVAEEVFDLTILVPDDFNEIPYTNAINTKKKAMEQFNTELQKIVDKGPAASIKQKDYSSLLNIIFHMLEDKNMLVFCEAMKSVELMSKLDQLKNQAKTKQYISVLASKYGETKTAVISATDKVFAAIVKHSLPLNSFCETTVNQIAINHKNPRVKQFLIQNTLSQLLHTSDSKELNQIFKTVNKSLTQLILKDTNDAVRNAAVQVLVEFGLLLNQDEQFQTQLQKVIEPLPKFRREEINRKLNPDSVPTLPTPTNQEASKTMPVKKLLQEQKEEVDEFSKTLEPAKHVQVAPAQFYQNLLRMIKLLVQNQVPASKLEQDFSEALQNEETLQILCKQRQVLTKALADVIFKGKSLAHQKEQIVQIVELIKELVMSEINKGQYLTVESLQEFVQVGLMLTDLQIEQEAGATSQVLSLALDSVHQQDVPNFLELLRLCVEQPGVLSCQNAISVIQNVYIWLGLKLPELIQAGLPWTDIEDLRSIGIKYLESTHLFTEQQRQSLIQTMLRFKERISETRCEQLQTLGNPIQSSRSHTSSQISTKQQTAQFNREDIEVSIQEALPAKPQITAQLICQTIDKEFEQGLLMFKELAQQSEGTLDFETKEKIFHKLLSIVSTDLSASQAQAHQYKQAYALKALMWMKEETMGLEDTFKLTSPIMMTYLQQLKAEIDTSVELYLLNFWVRELSIRDLCDRIQLCVLQIKPPTSGRSSSRTEKKGMSIEQLDAFGTLFCWMCEQKLEPSPSEWKMGDLRKIAILICESALNSKTKAKAICNSFISQLVEKEGQEKVVEFMEIQLMHSNEVLVAFLDYFNLKFPKEEQKKMQIPSVDVSKVIPRNQPEPSIHHDESITESAKQFANHVQSEGLQSSYLQQSQGLTERSVTDNQRAYQERRAQMKASQLQQNKETIEQQKEKLHQIHGQESGHKQSVQTYQNVEPMPAKRSRYDEAFLDEAKENNFQEEDELPIERIKESSQRLQSAKSRQLTEDQLQQSVQLSEAKQQKWVQQIIQLEGEKLKIEEETRILKEQKDQDTQQWRERLFKVQQKHEQVTEELSEVNQCYLQQVDENEKLKQQLEQMQQQHSEMIARFDMLEQRINSRGEEERNKTPPRSERAVDRQNALMNSVAKLKRISDTFQVSDQRIGVNKICELLLSVERNVDGELAKPLIGHYYKFKTVDERMSMISAIGESLSMNEDILLALSLDVYKALLNFLLRAFAHERERLDTQSIQNQGKMEQNQVTTESQKLVSRLLNSKDFTQSLVVLFQLLREALPSDISVQLGVEDAQYLRVLMRCISRITKALHSEAANLIRGFDVLLEMQKVFLICPPENLREDLPSLADFDFVFRGMRDVSDKFIELQPDKVMSFLGYNDTKQQPDNAFIKYLRLKATGAR